MADLTPRQQFPYPVGTESPNGPAQLQAALDAVESRVVQVFATHGAAAVADAAVAPTPGMQRVILTPPGSLPPAHEEYVGSAWVPVHRPPVARVGSGTGIAVANDVVHRTELTVEFADGLTPIDSAGEPATTGVTGLRVVRAGRYTAVASARWEPNNTGNRAMELCVTSSPSGTGGRIWQGGYSMAASGAGLAGGSAAALGSTLDVGDIVCMTLYQSSGGSLAALDVSMGVQFIRDL